MKEKGSRPNLWSNHEVSFFKKMIAKMGWTYSESDVVRPDVLRVRRRRTASPKASD